jgi:hypothetical protein
MILDWANGEPLEKYLILLLFFNTKVGEFFFGNFCFFSVNLTNFANYLENPENIYISWAEQRKGEIYLGKKSKNQRNFDRIFLSLKKISQNWIIWCSLFFLRTI